MCEALRVFERMQMAAACIEQAAKVALALHMGLKVGAVEEANRVVIIFILQFMHPLDEFPDLPRLDRHMQVVRAIVAGDCVALDQRLRQIERFDREIEHSSRRLWADLGDQFLLADGETKDRLAATTPRGTVADSVRFEERHPIAALGQMQRSRATRYAATDDAYVCALLPLQHRAHGRWQAGGARCTGGIVRAGGGVKDTQVFRILCLLTDFVACGPAGLCIRWIIIWRCSKRG